jgi:hypothetical protein
MSTLDDAGRAKAADEKKLRGIVVAGGEEEERALRAAFCGGRTDSRLEVQARNYNSR